MATLSATKVLAMLTAVLMPGIAAALEIQSLDPTPLFPRLDADERPMQMVLLKLDNPGAPLKVQARIRAGEEAPYISDLGDVPTGPSVKPMQIPDLTQSTTTMVELLNPVDSVTLARHEQDWQHQKNGKSSASTATKTLKWRTSFARKPMTGTKTASSGM